MTTGIYCIENMVNNRKYIGRGNPIEKRYLKHKSKLIHNKHGNKHLQNAWNKYGVDNFKFYIIKECEKQQLNELEIYYIKKFDTSNKNKGYNKTEGGKGSKGFKHSEDSKKIMSEKRKTRVGVNAPMYGKKHSEETKKKIGKNSKILKGNFVSEETKKKMRVKHKNKSSVYFGVRFKKDKKWEYWQAHLTINKKFKHISYHKTELEAAEAYNKYVNDNKLDYPLNILLP